MKQLVQVLYLPKNAKCVSLKPASYLIDTDNVTIAQDIADAEFKKDNEHHERYRRIYVLKDLYEAY